MTLRRVNRSPSRPSIRALLRRPLHPFRSSAPRSERGGPTGPAKPATRGVHLAVHPSSNLRFGPEHRASNRRSNLRPRTLALLLPLFTGAGAGNSCTELGLRRETSSQLSGSGPPTCSGEERSPCEHRGQSCCHMGWAAAKPAISSSSCKNGNVSGYIFIILSGE